MKMSRTIGSLLGAMFLLLGAGKAAWATDYNGTLAFDSYSATVPLKFGQLTMPVDVGVDLDRYNLGNALSGSAVNLAITTHNSFDTTGTMLVLLFTTDPNNAIFNNPTSLAALVNPNADVNSFLDAHVTGWTGYVYGDLIKSNGTTNISALFSPPLTFTAGTTYYAFVAGGTVKAGNLLTDPSVSYTLSVGAVPEPGEWAMMIAGLGVIGLLRRRRTVV